jgi:transposase
MLAQIDFLDETIATLSARIEELTRPFSREIELLGTIPGVDKRAAEMLLAEIGPDMSRFPTDAHLASWGGMCPGQRESGGKKHSAKTRNGSKWLRGTPHRVRQSGRAHQGHLPERPLPPHQEPPRTRQSDGRDRPQDPHRRLPRPQPRRPPPVAFGVLGVAAVEELLAEVVVGGLIRQLERLGHQVTLEPLPEAA